MLSRMIVTVGNTKGGVGKSTLSFLLALAWAIEGRDVLVVDGDRQGTVGNTVAVRARAGRAPGLTCVQYVEGQVLRNQVQRQAPKFDDVVIDAGGFDSSALRAALTLSDVAVVPLLPRAPDVWALRDMARLIAEVSAVRDGLRVRTVFNLADPWESAFNADAAAELAEFPDLVLLDTPIRRRMAFANAINLGMAVSELTPRDPKAVQEIDAMVTAVNSLRANCNAMVSNGG